MSSSGRIANNTVFLYIRMMAIMVINLFSVRVLLNALGQEDYGIYNVIAGVITMLSSVTSVLATATQRYYSYSMGEKNQGVLSNIFSTSINIYALLSLCVIIIGETIGLWFVNTQLVIPPDRIGAANWIYQFSILSFICGLLQAPYYSAVIAHENMGVFAVVSMIECVLKFLSALLLVLVLSDKLIIYGAFILVVHFAVFIIYAQYGRIHYSECRYKKVVDKSLYKQLFSFSGWTFFGSMASVGMNQVNNLLVNIFFGPIANASRGIALQIHSAMNAFCGSFTMAIRPPMIKAYADNDYRFLNRLFTLGNKFTYYSLIIIALPLYYEMDIILRLWLKEASEMTVLFSKLIVVYSVILALHMPITIIMQAMGKVKEYYLRVEIFTILCPFATLLLYIIGCPVESTFWAMIVAIFLSHLVRLWCLKKYYAGFSLRDYIKSFILPAGIITLIAGFIIHIIVSNMSEGLVRFTVVLFSSIILVLIFVCLFGLKKDEIRFIINSILKRK